MSGLMKTSQSIASRTIADGRRADKNIFYCTECDYCWEYESKRI